MADIEEKFSPTDKDDDVIATFNSWLKESETYHNALLAKQRISYEYYLGNQTYKDQLPPHRSDTVENRVFEAVETLVPVATSNAHQFAVLPASEDPKSLLKADKLRKVLISKYDVLEMQRKLEDITRHMCIFRFGVLKYEWDEVDIRVRVVDPRLILIPKLRLNPHDLPYVIEIQEYTRAEMEEYFPKYAEDFTESKKVDTGDDKKGVKQVFEVWTKYTVAWICENQVLDIKENPYYDFKGVKKKMIDKSKGKIFEKLRFFNHLEEPEKPYVFFVPFNVSDGPIAETSLVEVGIPIQDAINMQKRSIIDNLRKTGNGQVYVDADAMSQEEADNLTDEPGLIVRGAGVASENKVRREPGVPLPNAHFSNLQHSEAVFDNLMGTHSATRGQAQAKTLGQDILSRQQDFTRIDILTRELNRGVARLANGIVQLMKMFYTEAHTIKILGEAGSMELVKLSQEDIEDHIEVIVKSGINLPMDEISLRTEAVQLWQLNALGPVTLFERLKFPNPALSAQRLLAWKTGQLTQETQARIAEMEAQSAMNMQVEMKKMQAEGLGEKPGVETPMNVMQRAKAGLGGTAPTKTAK